MADSLTGMTRVAGLVAIRDVRKLLATGVFTGITRWTELLVIGIYTYQQTGSPLMVAIMAFLNAVPGTLFGALVGAMGERFDRRKLLLIGYSTALLLVTALAALGLTDQLELWHVAIGTFLGGTVWTMEYPVRRTLLGEFSGLERASTALTFDVATGTATMFAGPLLGGFLMRDYGLHAFYLMAAGSLCMALLFVSGVRFSPASTSVKAVRFLQSVRDGFIHVRQNKPVLGVLLITIILNFFGFSFMSMLPVIGAGKLGLGPMPIGILSSMEGAGALVGLLLLTLYATPRYFMRLFVGGTLSLLVAVMMFSVTPWFSLALCVLFIGGLGEAGFGAMQATITFTATPAAMRSRIMGLLVVCIGFGPLGMLHTGAMAEWLGADVAIGVIAIEGLLATFVCIWLLPTLRKSEVETPGGEHG
jgi:MFS family permease